MKTICKSVFILTTTYIGPTQLLKPSKRSINIHQTQQRTSA